MGVWYLQKVPLMNMRTLYVLSQWIFKRKCNNITKKYSTNKYVNVENEDSEPFV
jgi:hypothetical protein